MAAEVRMVGAERCVHARVWGSRAEMRDSREFAYSVTVSFPDFIKARASVAVSLYGSVILKISSPKLLQLSLGRIDIDKSRGE